MNLRTIGAVALGALCVTTYAQSRQRVIEPYTNHSSRYWDGPGAHTNFFILDGQADWNDTQSPRAGPYFAVPSGYGPDQVRAAYDLPPIGGSKIIAIVDAYHYPTALKDFNVFATQYGLPKETSTNPLASSNKVFQVVYAGNSQPAINAGWSQEMALDIEWAHAMAPNAKILLVEAANSSFSALSMAVMRAAAITGVAEVSMSWGAGDFGGETSFDTMFRKSNVCYFASSGDSGGYVSYPACSSKVISVGGTSLRLDPFGNFISEDAWYGSGSGASRYVPRPAFQAGLAVPGNGRCTADISLLADPYTGAAVYDSTPANGWSGWMVFGGTSLACPIAAGMHNIGGQFRGTAAEQAYIYSGAARDNFRDVTSGVAGSYPAKAGYDLPTGFGAPVGLNGL